MKKHRFPPRETKFLCASSNDSKTVKSEQDFEVAEPCKCDDFWQDASKIIDFLSAQGWEASYLWKWEKFGSTLRI